MTTSLPIPDVVSNASQSMEMCRIWIADGQQVAIFTPNLWDDPGAWGLMLVDLANHVAKAYEARGAIHSESLQKIRTAMEAEWALPTNPLT